MSAGQGGGNLEKLIAHYREKSFSDEESKVRKMKGEEKGQ